MVGSAGSGSPELRMAIIGLGNAGCMMIPAMVKNPRVKLAAAWLVDQCGWKGRREGKVGVHPQQAIVLVNYNHANGEELLALAARIQDSVYARFAVLLDIEPRVY